ncbi:MAG: hypothetical protein ABI635_09260 [Actinomycetota bacterium]
MLLLLGGSQAFASEPQTGDDAITAEVIDNHPGEILILSFSDVENMGYKGIYPPSDLSTCTPDLNFKGYETADDAAKAAAEADQRPACAVDPTTITFVIGAPAATSNHTTQPYHHNGQQTADNFQGGWGTFKVKDVTSLGHPGNGTQFLADRILVKKTTSPTACEDPNATVRWAETGWSEASWRSNTRFVYTWGTTDCMWRYYDEYALTDGNFYSWRVFRLSGGGLRTALLWDGTWNVLNDYNGPDCFNAAGDVAVCAVEDYVEIYTAVDNNHPDWTGTIGNKNLQLRKFNDSWIPWGSGVTTYTGDVSPYVYCMVSKYDDFTVQKGGNC